FTFVDDPLPLLRRVRPFIRKKIILDLNPRGKTSLRRAIEILKQAGFTRLAWRPFFVPINVQLPRPLLRTLCVCENIPGLRALPLRWRFNVLLMGETADDKQTRRSAPGRPKYL
ncbi:MAG TPA: hypothetical protein VNT76_00950, partial [Candidatus Binatus sp.]|nr:hypothetical protein [Candidatus Binatus sp.]